MMSLILIGGIQTEGCGSPSLFLPSALCLLHPPAFSTTFSLYHIFSRNFSMTKSLLKASETAQTLPRRRKLQNGLSSCHKMPTLWKRGIVIACRNQAPKRHKCYAATFHPSAIESWEADRHRWAFARATQQRTLCPNLLEPPRFSEVFLQHRTQKIASCRVRVPFT